MSLGLGIDTGGTYTDAVIYDFESKKIIASSKSLTMKEDLVSCIDNTLDNLEQTLLLQVEAVSLSTTLATNACIEERGGRAKLILIGCDRSIADNYGIEYGLPAVKDIIFLDGGHNMKGDIVAEPDWEYLLDKIKNIGDNTDSYAVVEIWGMNNCDFEKHTKELIIQLTDKKVVCGHELTAKINLLKRAASTLLNAQLIPIIHDFLKAIRISLTKRGINAPIAVVRGDGSLMNEDFALDHPVETLLSGPAASIEGGINLSNKSDCVVIDMGGTTSDIAVVKNGVPRLADEGAVVGKWRTGTHSMRIETMGLGGDSRIAFDDTGHITVGRGRVVPLSWAAYKWPVISEKVKSILRNKKKYFFPVCEFFYLIKNIDDDSSFTSKEREITHVLSNGPVGVIELAWKLESSLIETNTVHLEKQGIIGRIGLTPTDLMHINGDFEKWDKETAVTGAACMANQLDTEIPLLIKSVYEHMKEKLYIKIVSVLMNDEDRISLKDGMSDQLEKVLLDGFRKTRELEKGKSADEYSFLNSIGTPLTLIGIGAPVHVYIKDVAKALKTKCIIPEYAGVANAVGAITGAVRAAVVLSVTPEYAASGTLGYTVFSKEGRTVFTDYKKALEHARYFAQNEALEVAKAKGGKDIYVSLDVFENVAEVSAFGTGNTKCGSMKKCKNCNRDSNECEDFNNTVLVETKVTAVAVGKPSWQFS